MEIEVHDLIFQKKSRKGVQTNGLVSEPQKQNLNKEVQSKGNLTIHPKRY